MKGWKSVEELVGGRDQLSKKIFREESAVVTAGALEWEDPPEMAIHEARADGLLMVRDPKKAGRNGNWGPMIMG